MITLSFHGKTAGLLETIRAKTRQVVQDEHEPHNKKRYTILVHCVSLTVPLAAALGKLIASLNKSRDGDGICTIAKLQFYICRGFSAAVVAALFPNIAKGDLGLMESLGLSLDSMLEVNSFLAYIPKDFCIAKTWKFWAPQRKRPIVPEDARVFAHHLAQAVHGISQLSLTGFKGCLARGDEHPVLLLADRMASFLPPAGLHFVDCGLHDTTASKLIRLLSLSAKNIKSLSLSSSYLQEEAFAALGDWLTHPDCTLESLDVSDQNVWDAGTYYRPFFEILIRQNTIKQLNMAGNFFDDYFAPDIARVVCQNTCLQSWNLHQNRFGRDGMETLTNALKHAGANFQSVQLLSYSDMLQRGWTAMFVDALKTNPCLLSVTLSTHVEGLLPSSPDPPNLIQEYDYYLSLNKAGRRYFYLAEAVDEATCSQPGTRSPLPLALWPCLLARAALVASGGASKGDIIYRMLRDGPLVQEIRHLRQISD